MTVTAERHMEASVWSGGWGGAGSAKQLLTLVNIVTLMVLISLFTRTVFILLLLLSPSECLTLRPHGLQHARFPCPPCTHSRAIPSSPSQLEWKIGLAWANTRGSLNSPS